ncbi:MAG TPA: helicase-related protein [Gaiellaceae bacterium]|nr:helicase-related protein [Gaiellaceae bacterium]
MTRHPAGFRSEVLLNGDGETIGEALRRYLDGLDGHLRDPYVLAIATAYFDVGGFTQLRDQLGRAGRVRLLVGAEPQEPERRRRLRPGETPRAAARREREEALETHFARLVEARDALGFTIEADRATRALVDWLRNGRVEVRRLTSEFLHAKAILVETGLDGVVAGSANLTGAGLARNLELALGQFQPGVVERVADWFERWWDEAEPFDLAALYEPRFLPHAPYDVFLRMLWELYGAELEAEAAELRTREIRLTRFQEHGLLRAARILDERNGVLVADEVGLGKTFIAGELIRRAYFENRQRVLVVAPAALRDGPWRKFLARFDMRVETRSYEDLAADSRINPLAEPGHTKLEADIREYALVVVDEAHHARNPATQRAEALRRLLAGTPPKKLVLLTATPVNNSLWDLYALLSYFVKDDAAFLQQGIPSLRAHFHEAQRRDPGDLSPDHLFDVLDAVAVRRTRPFVRKWYADDRVERADGTEVAVEFPDPHPIRVDYDLEAVLPGFLERFKAALEVEDPLAPQPGELTMARYSASRYRIGQSPEQYEILHTGLVRSGLLKRFESSARAFAATCRTMAASHDAFLDLLDRGFVATGESLGAWAAADSDEAEELLAELEADLEPASAYDVERLRRDVAADRDLLLAFAAEAETLDVDSDPKFRQLVAELEAIAAEAEAELVGEQKVRDGRKALVFSYYSDTVEWILEGLERELECSPRLAPYRGRVAAISGKRGEKGSVVQGFAPVSSEAPEGTPELYDLLVTTDVLSEGVNLQQARHIVNYDLPWNPMRLVQRHGRIDRIGSQWGDVYLRCFFPDKVLDELLGLEERLHRKIAQAAASVGMAAEILPGSRTEDTVFAERREEIERLRRGDPTLFLEGSPHAGVVSGEELRQELRQALQEVGARERIESLPYGAGSGFAGPVGVETFVFCYRVADERTARLCAVQGDRVGLGDGESATLLALDLARPPAGRDEERVLDDWAIERAVAAWEIASGRIVEDWNRRADPANVRPEIPRAMVRAIELVRAGPLPEGMTGAEADELCERLQAPYAERYLRQFRALLREESIEPSERIARIAALADDLGLEKPAPIPDLPEIEADDLHVVCWMCVSPSVVTGTRGA